MPLADHLEGGHEPIEVGLGVGRRDLQADPRLPDGIELVAADITDPAGAARAVAGAAVVYMAAQKEPVRRKVALKVIKPVPSGTPHIVNSIMVRPERYERMVPMVAEHNVDFIALMWGPEGLPRDENERAALAVELMYFANEAGIPNEKIWVDGIVTPVNIQQPQLMSLMAFMEMLPEISPGAKSTCGLSNISFGLPERKFLNQTFMVMAIARGLDGAIVDPLDKKMMANIIAAEALAGNDEWCSAYLEAYRNKKFEF